MLRLHLLIETPDHPDPKSITLERFPARLGRALENDISLPFASVSGHHLRIEVDARDRLLITDLGSTNGTCLLGRPIPAHSPQPLPLPSSIKLGDISIHLSLQNPSEPELPAFTTAHSATELRALVTDSLVGPAEDSRPFFEILSGPGAGRRFHPPLSEEPISLGASPKAHIALPLSHLPEKIASLKWDLDGLWLDPLPTSSPIACNHSPLHEPRLLRSQDRIVIDILELLYFDPLEGALDSLRTDLRDLPEEPQAPLEEPPPNSPEKDLPHRTSALPAEPPSALSTEQRPRNNEKAPRRRLGALEIAFLATSLFVLLGTLTLLVILFS